MPLLLYVAGWLSYAALDLYLYQSDYWLFVAGAVVVCWGSAWMLRYTHRPSWRPSMHRRHTILFLSVLLGAVAWWSCAIAVAQSGTTTSGIPSLENLVITTPLAGITLFLVKWLLTHLDAQRSDQQRMISEFHTILGQKDADFARFVETTYVRLDEYSKRLSDLARSLLGNSKERP